MSLFFHTRGIMRKSVILCMILVFSVTGFPLFANETIAIHPFQGEPEEIANAFFDILVDVLLDAPDLYTVFPIFLDNLSPDIPSGGFPAHVCPSPSLTADASYTITGELNCDIDYPGSYRIRLYLWEMEEGRLLVNDEMTASDRESCENRMPYMLDWLLSWIGRDKELAIPAVQPVVEAPLEPQVIIEYRQAPPPPWDSSRWSYIGPKGAGGEKTTAIDNPEQWMYLGPEREKWLHLGIRGGMGSSQWFQKASVNQGLKNQNISNFWSANTALQVSLHLTRFFDIQTEANVAADFGKIGDNSSGSAVSEGIAAAWSLTLPILARLNLRGSHLKAGILGGLYLYLPLGATNADSLKGYMDYRPDQPGFMFGLNLGWKVGPGYLFLDGRFEYDGNWFNPDRGIVYYRNSIKVNTGYEFGLIDKKR